MRKDEARQARIHDRLLVAVVALTKLGDPLSPDPPATLSAEREETQLAAANSYLNREEGTPVQRVVTASVTDPSQLTDEDLAAIAASGRRGALAAPEDTD
jgi:hypothetical protein